MGQVMFIVWRESVEALLVVGILYAWLNNGDAAARRGLPYLWAGVAAGVLLAILLGFALLGFSELLSGEAQTYFQIGMVLIAAMLIVQMVLWMRKHGRTLKKDMETSLKSNYDSGNWWGVFTLAALAIAREGSETAVFLYGLGVGQQGNIGPMLLAALLGLALAFLTFYLLQLGGKLFSWRRFFQVTEIMLLLLAAGLMLTGVEKLFDLLLENVDWVSNLSFASTLTAPMWDSSALLDDSGVAGGLMASLVGYRAHPTLLALFAYVVYWALIWRALQPRSAAASSSPLPKTS
ncbi:FTR1 family protein [Herbaspirillum sp. RTI4]|uniref:FTR1 family iron permease n=1 Tax=Herbaspirillum sp. RTI4 TaxID=3048640 RepID=UPI002AB45998|nr:FTR1 family protein [Herbaspirillum sp. RTI4]MDY7578864.1 FTR1 family protein [Herbaspirillum sp. RTI4]MEA9983007.1 FTR1 family protein [Herbaspirillum sp. RTI4]